MDARRLVAETPTGNTNRQEYRPCGKSSLEE
jgi:hypothetical protein